MPYITLDDLAKSFGTSASDLNEDVRQYYTTRIWEYEEIKGADEDQVIKTLTDMLAADRQKVGAPGRKDVWLKGWQENLDAFVKSGNLDDLVPHFVRPNQIIRFNRKFIRPANQQFELDYIRLFQKWLASTFADFGSIYEFGCGSGCNLVAINQMVPGKTLYGCDFVQSSVDLMDRIAEQTSSNMHGVLFDMSDPDFGMSLDENSCVFTFGAIEQIPGKFKRFVEYLVEQKPALCMHVEPTIELYDPTNRVDQTAIAFHLQRGYTTGFLPLLQDLDRDGKIDLMKVHHMQFGSFRMEGYNHMIWKTK